MVAFLHSVSEVYLSLPTPPPLPTTTRARSTLPMHTLKNTPAHQPTATHPVPSMRLLCALFYMLYHMLVHQFAVVMVVVHALAVLVDVLVVVVHGFLVVVVVYSPLLHHTHVHSSHT